MTQNDTAEEVRDLTSAEIGQTSGGNIAVAAANAVANMIRGWELIGCGSDAIGNYCDYSIPKQ